ncbi:hypothetical protein KIPB_010184 [Kipferlia bialata]|uniref:VPS37 C-terminal domain-containing protein n=1 Tax=Kipferlia bialata TaxID=797122 RepID=A0A9K3D4X8_9EUKA|nr:hypothetical protein KIPB_010184 [Kipferlia bialata]|eukprot:g10184.t1
MSHGLSRDAELQGLTGIGAKPQDARFVTFELHVQCANGVNIMDISLPPYYPNAPAGGKLRAAIRRSNLTLADGCTIAPQLLQSPPGSRPVLLSQRIGGVVAQLRHIPMVQGLPPSAAKTQVPQPSRAPMSTVASRPAPGQGAQSPPLPGLSLECLDSMPVTELQALLQSEDAQRTLFNGLPAVVALTGQADAVAEANRGIAGQTLALAQKAQAAEGENQALREQVEDVRRQHAARAGNVAGLDVRGVRRDLSAEMGAVDDASRARARDFRDQVEGGALTDAGVKAFKADYVALRQQYHTAGATIKHIDAMGNV